MMRNENMIEPQNPQCVQTSVSKSLLSCKFCNGFAPHAIDKGEWNLNTGWEFKVWICTNCLIDKNPHLISHNEKESIMYIAPLSSEDRAAMCNVC